MNAYLFDAVRTPRALAKENGALHSVSPIQLLAPLYRALQERNRLDTSLVDDVVLGCVTQTGEQGANIAKISSLVAKWSTSISGVTLNRFCASGLSAIEYAALKVHSGMERLVVAGGVESMSRVPMLADRGAWFTDPAVMQATKFVHMGVSADLIASLYGFTREQVDQYAVESQRRALVARQEGRFSRSMISVLNEAGEAILSQDDAIRGGITTEKLARFAPLFALPEYEKIALAQYPSLRALSHVHHPGNAPAMVDGASLVLLGTKEAGESLGLKPRARVLSFANHSVEPVVMLTAPAPALQKALSRAGRSIQDLALVECNESFSATVLAFLQETGLPAEKVNVNGGAISMGHPLGATGGVLVSMLIDELERQDKALGAVVMCAGAGIGAALVIERVA
jgi:acetyl-CoA C-acetyltransferase